MKRYIYKILAMLSVVVGCLNTSACPQVNANDEDAQDEAIILKLVEKGLYDQPNAELYVRSLTIEERMKLLKVLDKASLEHALGTSMIGY